MHHAILSSIFLLAVVTHSAQGLSLSRSRSTHQKQPNNHRRTFLLTTVSSLATVTTASSSLADTGAEVRGTAVTPFNGLIFQYRGNDFEGLSASDIDEPSISYADFLEKLTQSTVESVTFYAPNGDVAYVKLKDRPEPIRIGEGYPIEQSDGWSSPAFAVRTVKNAGVPYKFVVPALQK